MGGFWQVQRLLHHQWPQILTVSMRYLIDTNIFVYAATDRDSLSRDVKAILEEPDTILYMSAESVRELIVAYRNKGL